MNLNHIRMLALFIIPALLISCSTGKGGSLNDEAPPNSNACIRLVNFDKMPINAIENARINAVNNLSAVYDILGVPVKVQNKDTNYGKIVLITYKDLRITYFYSNENCTYYLKTLTFVSNTRINESMAIISLGRKEITELLVGSNPIINGNTYYYNINDQDTIYVDFSIFGTVKEIGIAYYFE